MSLSFLDKKEVKRGRNQRVSRLNREGSRATTNTVRLQQIQLEQMRQLFARDKNEMLAKRKISHSSKHSNAIWTYFQLIISVSHVKVCLLPSARLERDAKPLLSCTISCIHCASHIIPYELHSWCVPHHSGIVQPHRFPCYGM